MHYRILTALALFICAAMAAPPVEASEQYIVAPEDDVVRATHLSSTNGGFSADTHEWDVIDGFVGVFGDPQAQSIDEDEIVGVKSLVVQ